MDNQGLPLWVQIFSLLLNATGIFKFIFDFVYTGKKVKAETSTLIDASNMSVVKVSDELLKLWMQDANKAIRAVNQAELTINNFKIVLQDGIEIIKECKPDGYKTFIRKAEAMIEGRKEIEEKS